MCIRTGVGTLALMVVLAALAPAATAQYFSPPGTVITNLSPPPVTLYPAWGWPPFTPVVPSYTYAPPVQPIYNVVMAPPAPEGVSARREKGNRLLVQWSGDASTVKRVTFSLLDRKGSVLARKTVTRLPAQARLRLTKRAAYYRVAVAYVNGRTNSVVLPV